MLDRQVAAIVWRTFGQDRIEAMAAVSRVPVVNALTDEFHPCQILADLQTVARAQGRAGRARRSPTSATAPTTWRTPTCSAAPRPACTSGSARRRRSSPTRTCSTRAARDRRRDRRLGALDRRRRGGRRRRRRPGHRHLGVDGPGGRGRRARSRPFLPYAVDEAALALAAADAVVLHCLPAYRGKEIAAEVIDGPQSVVWDEAENRLHAQKALLAWLLERHDGRDARPLTRSRPGRRGSPS